MYKNSAKTVYGLILNELTHPRGSSFAPSFTSEMSLILGNNLFAGKGAVDVSEVSGCEQNPKRPPHRANLQAVIATGTLPSSSTREIKIF